MQKIILLLVILTSSAISKAQLYFQNNTAAPVKVAIVYYADEHGFNGWVSFGWSEVAPHKKAKLVDRTEPISKLYYYAYSEADNKSYDGDFKAAVDPKNTFQIWNANLDDALKGTYEWRYFRKIKRPFFGQKYTIKLTS